MVDAIVLAAEMVPPEHPAAKLAVPLGILVFGGSVYLLLWSIYGAKKGALVYGTAFFGVSMMLGVFWWLGAPGTPVATGLQNFPGQPPDAYMGHWYPFEPGSERATHFPSSNTIDNLVPIHAFLGMPDATRGEREESPTYRALAGDVEQSTQLMIAQLLNVDPATGQQRIGAMRRQQLLAAAGEPLPGEQRARPFFTGRVAPDPLEPEALFVRITREAGLKLAGARLQVVATFTYFDEAGAPQRREVVVEERDWFAFKDPGALWFPSALWTGAAAALFALCLFGLDRVEQREKARTEERVPVGATAS